MTAKRQHKNAVLKSLRLESCKMRNKVKRSSKDAPCSVRGQRRITDVITVKSSETSSSNDETVSVSPAVEDACSADFAAGISSRDVAPLQEERKVLCAKGFKIAPVFLRTLKSKRSSDEKRGQPAERLHKSVHPPQTEDVQPKISQKLLATVSHLSSRKRLSPSALHSCLEAIQTTNPGYPVQAVFNTLQKKANLQNSAENSLSPSPLQNHFKEKRKRGNESTERMHKRLRSEDAAAMDHRHKLAHGFLERPVLTAMKQPRSNKLSRTHRLRQQSGSPQSLLHNAGLIDQTESCNQSLIISDLPQRACLNLSFEDVLWTDKYSPQHSSEVVGNSASVDKLQSWLKKWKLRADCDERRKTEERKLEENSNDSWDCGDFQGEAGAQDNRGELLRNTMLITGAPGVGKTAAVYACSQELGFKVFEVNCSSQRNGCHVLSQLKEATQSHLVETSGKDPLKPTYFNNYSSVTKSETLPVRPKKFTSTSKKRAAQKFGRFSCKGKANPSTVTLASYFKMKAKADHLHLSGLPPSEKQDRKTSSGNPSPGCDQSVPHSKKTATSLILFEEVDVIFDDDVGFLAAIKTFMTTTKRPVVLTTNDPLFRERFSCSLEEIIFKTPSLVNVCSYLQLVALAENVRLELDDIFDLVRLSRGDVRRCLLQLQLWVHSGGGRSYQREGLSQEFIDAKCSSATEGGDNIDSHHPECDTGCTASMLGLHPVTQNQLSNLLQCQFLSERDTLKLLRLLAESWRGGVPLLYSNLELLLPFDAKGSSVLFLDKGPCSRLQSDRIQKPIRNVSPLSSVTNSKPVQNISRLSRKKYITKTFDTTSSVSVAQTCQRTSISSRNHHSGAPDSRDAKQNAANLATDCIDALTDFFDLMSYLDATMPAAAPLVSGPCRREAFVWSGAEIKDGLLDEMRVEEGGRSLSQDRLSDFQAAVEGFGCRRCLRRVFEALTEAEKHRQELGDTQQRLVERLLPASAKKQSFSFIFQPPCAPSVAQRRYELNRTVLGSKTFSLLGNSRAVSVDYMPILRHICRIQRAQQQKEEPVRCLNYLSSKNLGLSKSTIQLLSEDFL